MTNDNEEAVCIIVYTNKTALNYTRLEIGKNLRNWTTLVRSLQNSDSDIIMMDIKIQ